MNNRWTGGQYSLFRIIFGLYLSIHFANLLPWASETFSSAGVLARGSDSPLLYLFPNILALIDSPWFVTTLVATATLASLFFIAGYKDRFAAIWMWYVLACLFGRNPLTSNPSLPFVGWMLLAHILLPPAPYGSRAATKRIDPDGGWHFPKPIFLAAWIVLAVSYSYSGYTKLISPSWVDGSAITEVLENPLARPTFLREWLLAAPVLLLQIMTWGGLLLELLFAPLALIRPVRPWLWLAALLMHLGLIVLIDFADLSFGMVMIHLFTFDPSWIPARKSSEVEKVFYDGSCGLCHRAVRFILAEDSGKAFQLAPLQSEALAQEISEEQRQELPDSIVVMTANRQLLMHSSAVLHILARLGGAWRICAAIMWLVPRVLRDAIYRFIAAIRYKLFARPKDACPLLPPHLRERFLL